VIFFSVLLTTNCLTLRDVTYGGQCEEGDAEDGAEGGDEFAGPGDWHRVTVADSTQRHLRHRHHDRVTAVDKPHYSQPSFCIMQRLPTPLATAWRSHEHAALVQCRDVKPKALKLYGTKGVEGVGEDGEGLSLAFYTKSLI